MIRTSSLKVQKRKRRDKNRELARRRLRELGVTPTPATTAPAK